MNIIKLKMTITKRMNNKNEQNKNEVSTRQFLLDRVIWP